MATIRFPLHEIDVAGTILKFLNSNIDELCPALSFPGRDRNDMVQIGDVSATKVRIQEDGTLEIDYEYSWSFYAGCKDISDSGLAHETVEAQLVGGVIEFYELECPEPRSPSDEF